MGSWWLGPPFSSAGQTSRVPDPLEVTQWAIYILFLGVLPAGKGREVPLQITEFCPSQVCPRPSHDTLGRWWEEEEKLKKPLIRTDVSRERRLRNT